MRKHALATVPPGAVLAQSVVGDDGLPLLREGTMLTPGYVRALERRGTAFVYLRDGLADDLAPARLVSDQVRSAASSNLATVFEGVAELATERGIDQPDIESIDRNLGEVPLLGTDDPVEQLYLDVERIIDEVMQVGTVQGLESLQHHHPYTFRHSVDVAVIGVLIGRRLGLGRDRLRELAVGCLLHDIGKTYIDEALLDKPGKLTAEEFALVAEHPRMGFELVRRMPTMRSILPAHVAYQHHERQDGSGYPRGLVGDNQVAARIARERIGSKHMLLIAEIAAVADVYSAVSSDRSYRAAMLPDQTAKLLDKLAGDHLNRDVVHALREVVPAYPVGRWVGVSNGTYAGWSGVVERVSWGNDQVEVRLVVDSQGRDRGDPPQLNTEPDLVGLRCLPDDEIPAAIVTARHAA